jgi:hypothetical protein
LVFREADMTAETTDRRGGALGDVAEEVGRFLGEAEKRLRTWNGPRDALVKTLVEVRDRASAMLEQLGVEESAPASKDAAGPVE